MTSDRPRHPHASTWRFVTRLLPDRAHLRALLDSRPDVVELLGCALWDVFSNNHSVVDTQGTEYDLGSFRASAAFIADAINVRYDDPAHRYGYLDFYMGTPSRQQRDVVDLYRWIFAQLKDAGCRWIYSFPRVYLVDVGGTCGDDDFTAYDPSRAVRADLARADRDERMRDLIRELERLHEEAVRRARREPLPTVVAAHRDVYGRLPEGWPHPDM